MEALQSCPTDSSVGVQSQIGGKPDAQDGVRQNVAKPETCLTQVAAQRVSLEFQVAGSGCDVSSETVANQQQSPNVKLGGRGGGQRAHVLRFTRAGPWRAVDLFFNVFSSQKGL